MNARRLVRFVLATLLLPGAVLAGPPGPVSIGGQKVLTLVSRDPPGVRCNNNIQVAAELSNLYKVPVLVVPVSQAGPGAKAPAVYFGDQLLAVDGGAHNGMVSFQLVADVAEIEGTPRQDRNGRLSEVRREHEALKTVIKAGN